MSKSMYDTTLVEDLAKLLNEHELAEIEYDTEGLRLRVTRVPSQGFMPPPPPVFAAQVPAQTTVSAAVPAAPAAEKPEAEVKGEAVKSPMVGVVYTAPEPNAAPYVSVGDTVSADQTLFLVEAMKTFNPVKAPRSGKVVQILVSDRSPVEYDQPLLILE
ncbi:MAG: acetyl-CoA carboxylase biotin carboxyl carrier protein [Alphaproteobacteria bacterium]|nr:acetyl-CoA carboxylase biotin carboxyl carrier protein [Alphaproteobacteria bacterium]